MNRPKLVVALVLLGCSGTETGNPGKSTAALSLGVTSSSPDVTIGSGASGVRVEGAWVSFSRIASTGCPASHGGELAPAFAVDLLDPDTALLDLDLGDQPLCGLELELAPAPMPAAPTTSSIALSGVRVDDAPFVITTPATLPIALQTTAEIDPGQHPALLLGFDLAVWLSGTDLAGVPLNPEGVAQLDGHADPAAVATFEAQVVLGAALYSDTDADGVLDDNERATPLSGH